MLSPRGCRTTARGMRAIRFPGLLEPAPSGIGFFRQIEEHLDDAGIFICCRIEKEPVINETLYRGDGSALLCRSRANDGNRAELLVKEQSRLRHDQVGLELVGNVSAAGTVVG